MPLLDPVHFTDTLPLNPYDVNPLASLRFEQPIVTMTSQFHGSHLPRDASGADPRG